MLSLPVSSEYDSSYCFMTMAMTMMAMVVAVMMAMEMWIKKCLTSTAEIGPREDVFQTEKSGFSSVSSLDSCCWRGYLSFLEVKHPI